MTGLTHLDLRDTSIIKLPAAIGQLQSLTHFSIGGEITVLPPEVGNLNSLEELFVSGRISSLPPEIWQLSNLRKLMLKCTSIRTIPSEIVGLQKLEQLLVGGLPYRTATKSFSRIRLPVKLGQLSRLKILQLEYIRGFSLPKSVLLLQNLEVLDLTGARCAFPKGMAKVKNLKKLNVCDNDLKEIPE